MDSYEACDAAQRCVTTHSPEEGHCGWINLPSEPINDRDLYMITTGTAGALSPEERGGIERWGLTELEYREGAVEFAAELEAERQKMAAEQEMWGPAVGRTEPRHGTPFVGSDGRFLAVFEDGTRTHFTSREDVETYVFETRGYTTIHVEIGTPGW